MRFWHILILSVLAMLTLRASSASQDIGIGNVALYSPEIDAMALVPPSLDMSPMLLRMSK